VDLPRSGTVTLLGTKPKLRGLVLTSC